VAAPTVRLAQPADVGAIEAFRCGHSPWYVNDTAKVIRRAASLLDGSAPRGLRVLLFEHADDLEAISVLQRAPAPRTVDLVALALRTRSQGAWLDETPKRPLCVAVLEETVRLAAREGYKQIVAMAADQNEKSVRLMSRAGFVKATRVDGDYTLYAASLDSNNAG
jgi:hypothetical protein